MKRNSLIERSIIALVILYALALLGGPLIAIVYGALQQGVGAFVSAISSPDALSALQLTLTLATAATIINTIFGVVIALALARDRFTGQRIINGIIDLPFAVSPVIAGFMLILLFGRAGWFAPLIEGLGIKIVFAWPGMLLATIFVSLPFVIRELLPVLRQIGDEQEDVAYTLGASHWQAFWHITLPNIRWALFYGISLTFARAVGEFGAVLVVSGGVSQLTESSTLFIYRSLDDRNYVGAYAMSLALLILSLIIIGLRSFHHRDTEIS